MEALRRPCLAPSAVTVLAIFGCAHAMKEMVMIRYATKDDDLTATALIPEKNEADAQAPMHNDPEEAPANQPGDWVSPKELVAEDKDLPTPNSK